MQSPEIVRYVTEVHVGRTLWSSVHLAIDRDFRDLSLPGRQLRLQAADRIEHLDRWIVARCAKLPGKNDVAVQNRANGIADGFVEIVSFDQDGKESGDRAV